MPRLSDTDVRSLLAFVHEAALEEGPDPLPRPLLQQLERIVPADFGVEYYALDTVTCELVHAASDRDIEYSAIINEAFSRYGPEFPLSACISRCGVVRLSDVMTRRELHRHPFYNEAMWRLGLEHTLKAWLPSSRRFAVSIEFGRGPGRDFGPRDRLVVDVLVPHFALLRERAAARSRPTPAALGLTPRETEVLHWVSIGKTNAEIAETLYVSRGTVRTHLENVYEKLGVHTRTAAVARAFNGSQARWRADSRHPA